MKEYFTPQLAPVVELRDLEAEYNAFALEHKFSHDRFEKLQSEINAVNESILGLESITRVLDATDDYQGEVVQLAEIALENAIRVLGDTGDRLLLGLETAKVVEDRYIANEGIKAWTAELGKRVKDGILRLWAWLVELANRFWQGLIRVFGAENKEAKALEKRIEELEKRNAMLESEVEELRAMIDALENKYNVAQDKIISLAEEIKFLTGENTRFNKTAFKKEAFLSLQISQLEAQIKELEDKLSKPNVQGKLSSEEKVAIEEKVEDIDALIEEFKRDKDVVEHRVKVKGGEDRVWYTRPARSSSAHIEAEKRRVENVIKQFSNTTPASNILKEHGPKDIGLTITRNMELLHEMSRALSAKVCEWGKFLEELTRSYHYNLGNRAWVEEQKGILERMVDSLFVDSEPSVLVYTLMENGFVPLANRAAWEKMREQGQRIRVNTPKNLIRNDGEFWLPHTTIENNLGWAGSKRDRTDLLYSLAKPVTLVEEDVKIEFKADRTNLMVRSNDIEGFRQDAVKIDKQFNAYIKGIRFHRNPRLIEDLSAPDYESTPLWELSGHAIEITVKEVVKRIIETNPGNTLMAVSYPFILQLLREEVGANKSLMGILSIYLK